MFTSIISRKDEDTAYADVAQEDLYDGEENYIRLQIVVVIIHYHHYWIKFS